MGNCVKLLQQAQHIMKSIDFAIDITYSTRIVEVFLHPYI